MITTIIGSLAAIFTTFASLPQLIKLLKSKEAKDVSLKMFIIMFIGLLLWLVYGFLMKDIVIIAANLVNSVLVSTNIYFIIKYSKK
jgi:MtN3 and saliva related transmembrane protein